MQIHRVEEAAVGVIVTVMSDGRLRMDTVSRGPSVAMVASMCCRETCRGGICWCSVHSTAGRKGSSSRGSILGVATVGRGSKGVATGVHGERKEDLHVSTRSVVRSSFGAQGLNAAAVPSRSPTKRVKNADYCSNVLGHHLGSVILTSVSVFWVENGFQQQAIRRPFQDLYAGLRTYFNKG